MKITIRNEYITEAVVSASLGELVRNPEQIGSPCLLLIHPENILSDIDDPDIISFFRNAPFLTAVINNNCVNNCDPFDFSVDESEKESFLSRLFDDKTPLQCREITKCFTASRSGDINDVFTAESVGFYRLMAEKNKQKKAVQEQDLPENTPEAFSLSESDGILTLSMNAAGNNLMTSSFFHYYEETMEKIGKLAGERKYKGLIITGAGRHFSVGADVAALAQRSASETCDADSGIFPKAHVRQKHFFTFLSELPFPVVSTVSGFCIGSGSEIAVNCHYRICEKTARTGQPESTFGILPALGGIARTIRICGMKNAYRMIMTGELINADTAHSTGWADIVVDKKKSCSEAATLINYISVRYDHFDCTRTGEYLAGYLAQREV